MNNDLKKLELERQNANKKFYIFLLIGIAIIGIFAVISFLYLIELIIVGLIIGLIFIGISIFIRKNFQKKFKEIIVTQLIKQELGENAVYRKNGGIDMGSILEHRMYRHPDRSRQEDYISAKFNDVEYIMSDAHFEERHVTYDSKGNRRVTYTTYFNGRIILIKLKRNLKTRLKIVEGHPSGFSKQGMEKFETELIDFNKKYDTYVDEKEKGFYMLTPVMLQKMLDLEKLFKGTIQYSFEGDSLMIFINNNGDSLEFPLGKKINEENLNIIRSQITLAATIINEFKLDSDKYQNNDLNI